MCEALKLPSRSLAWQLNHIFYDAAGGYCAVPTFLRVFPVSAPCLSSSFKSIYCSQKSIRLSEERCRFSGYGSQLSHFLPHTHTHTHTHTTVMAKVPVCRFFFFFFFFFFFWVVTVRKKCHTSLEKERGRAKPFSLGSQINGRRLSLPRQETQKAFLCWIKSHHSLSPPLTRTKLSPPPGLTS